MTENGTVHSHEQSLAELIRQVEAPVGALRGYVELLALDDRLLADPSSRRDHLSVIREHTARISDLVSRLAERVEDLERLSPDEQLLTGETVGLAPADLRGSDGECDPGQLSLVTAYALQAIRDVRHLRERTKAEQQARELAEAQQLRAVVDIRTLFRRASILAKQLDQAYLDTITALAKAVEARDQYTSYHVERVRAESMRIARRFGLSKEALRYLEFGAVLHDVGKLGIPDAILGKPGPLTPVELETMRHHPTIGRRLLEGIRFLGPALPAVESHHERWDGLGYPRGLSKDAIPLEGRIVAVADAYDAMTSDRPYRLGMSDDAARTNIAEGRGSQFAPDVVDAFLADHPGPTDRAEGS